MCAAVQEKKKIYLQRCETMAEPGAPSALGMQSGWYFPPEGWRKKEGRRRAIAKLRD